MIDFPTNRIRDEFGYELAERTRFVMIFRKGNAYHDAAVTYVSVSTAPSSVACYGSDHESMDLYYGELKVFTELLESLMQEGNEKMKSLIEVPADINPMLTKKSWHDFRAAGMLWFINMILHAFGWALTVETDASDNIVAAYPARTKFRGFCGEINDQGYINVSKYLKDNAEELYKEAVEP